MSGQFPPADREIMAVTAVTAAAVAVTVADAAATAGPAVTVADVQAEATPEAVSPVAATAVDSQVQADIPAAGNTDFSN